MNTLGHADELDELRRQLAAVTAERDDLATERDSLGKERDQALEASQQAGALNSSLSQELLEARRTICLLQAARWGRKSERLTSDQLEDLGQAYFDFVGAKARDENGEPQIACPPATPEDPNERRPPKPKQRRTRRRKMEVSKDAERIVTAVEVPADERGCTHCGVEMKPFGAVEHETVEFVPARFVVHVERREKLACRNRNCQGEAVTAERQDPAPTKRRVGVTILAQLIEAKCDDALPIHRQCDQFARLGFHLPEETAYGYWKQGTSILTLLANALFGLVMQDPNWVGLDDTGLDVLDRTRKGGKFRGHLWCARASSGLVAYRFTETWKASEIEPWIALLGPETKVQVDDYKGYSKVFARPDGKELPLIPEERRLGCMMHVRRRFFKAFKAGDKRARKAVKWIKDIYKIEERARGMPPDEREALRAELSIPILNEFYKWVSAQEKILGKTGLLEEAVRYAYQQETYVRACFMDGRYEIDNGACEREIREPAIGRRNFLFTGSVDAAHRMAAAYSIVQTCRNLGINTREYLIDVLKKIEAGWPMRKLTELLPHRWAGIEL